MSQRDSGVMDAGSIGPLYQRLPRGPHHLDPREVIRHQRLRMYGAMVEAVDECGYRDTSVKQIIGLAGVSRRAFYEQFANKEECFLATFDAITARYVRRSNEAYRSTRGDLEQRIRAAVGGFTDEIDSNAKGASLAIVQAQTAGAAGLIRLRKVTGTFEQMLSSSFAHAPDAGRLPVPIVRGIVGGMQEATSARLRAGRPEEIPALNEEIVRWTLLFHTPTIARLSELLKERARASSMASAGALRSGYRNGHSPGADSALDAWLPPNMRAELANRPLNGNRPGGAGGAGTPRDASDGPDARRRLLQTVFALAITDGYHTLTAPQIFEEAGVSMDEFFEQFEDKEECFLAAFDALSDDLLLLAADPDLVSDEWPHAVRRVIGELLSLLAAHPQYAQMIAVVAPGAGGEALARNFDLAHGIATLLTEGAPEPARSTLAVDGVAGAIWHTIRGQVVSGQIHLLPALADYLAYVVLAPFIGADAAAEIVIGYESELTAEAPMAG
jgi:TetR/AcrR family transcriptional regulator